MAIFVLVIKCDSSCLLPGFRFPRGVLRVSPYINRGLLWNGRKAVGKSIVIIAVVATKNARPNKYFVALCMGAHFNCSSGGFCRLLFLTNLYWRAKTGPDMALPL